MDLFVKTIGAVVVTVVLIFVLEKQTSALLLTIVVCAMTAGVAVSYLSPIKDLLMELKSLADLQDGLLEILLKCVGIAVISEVVGLLCQDAGVGSLKKTVQFLGNSVILFLSIPVFRALLRILKDILSEL